MIKEYLMKTTTHKKWLEELTLELRLKDFSGRAIGDVLATVKEFLADSDQQPESAFGTPRDYAAQLAAVSVPPAKADLRGTLSLSTASLVAFLVFSAGLTPWLKGEELLVGGWQLVSTAVLAALVLALPLYLSFLLRHMWALVAVPVVGGAAGVLSAVLSPKDAGEALMVLPPAAALIVGAGLMIVFSVAGTIPALREAPDPIVGPLESTPAATVKTRWLEILTQWLFPIFSLVLLGFTLLITTLS